MSSYLEHAMYVYVMSEPGLYTVGHYDPQGKWEPESDHGFREEAAARVHYLNGGPENFTRSQRIREPKKQK